MSYTLAVGSDGASQTAEVVWSVNGKTYKFRSDNNFIAWITTIFDVGDVASGAGTIDYRLLRPMPATDAALGNVAGGNNALSSNTTGNLNSAFGKNALQANTIGVNNSAVGASALLSNTAGTGNSALGYNALQANTTGVNNSAVGTFSLFSNATGVNNSAVGASALLSNTGNNNSALGASALKTNASGTNNTAVGYEALNNNTTANDNTAVGTQALARNTIASANTALGAFALIGNNGANGANTCVGAYSLFVNTGAHNTGLGCQAGQSIASGNSNTILGSGADVDSGARSFCVVLGRGTTSPALDGTLSIGGTGGNAMTGLISSTATPLANTHLRIYLNGTEYKIKLDAP